MGVRYAIGLAVGLFGLLATALAGEHVVIEDWTSQPLGAKGIPAGWQKQNWGKPAYDFAIVQSNPHRVLQLRSAGDSSTITKDIKGQVDLAATPVLEWRWKVVALPQGGDARKKETDDQAAQIYVAWPRFPEAVRSLVIGYIWDTTAPVGTTAKSEKNGAVTYIVVRSGSAGVGKWFTERRNVVEDYKRVFGEEPGSPGGISVAIDSDDVKGTAEAVIGPIVFRKP